MKRTSFLLAIVAMFFSACTEKNSPTDNTNSTGDGILSGKFSVSASKTVHFSQGNLQYVGTWQFAAHQWEYFGKSQSNDHRDLFGWGTGDAPNQCTDRRESYATYTEWGKNAIINGSNTANLWRTMTCDEWKYLFYGRKNAAILFGLGSVNGVNGTILLPDDWTTPEGASFTASTTKDLIDKGEYYYNPDATNFSHNTYTIEQWAVMETAGAVFLPAAGGRWGNDVYSAGTKGNYWSSTLYITDIAYVLKFDSRELDPETITDHGDGCIVGRSVRLVR